MSHDRKFFDTFMLILGALILFSVAMIVLAKFIGARQREFIAEDPAVIGQLEERIKPFGSVAVDGQVDTVAQELAAMSRRPQARRLRWSRRPPLRLQAKTPTRAPARCAMTWDWQAHRKSAMSHSGPRALPRAMMPSTQTLSMATRARRA